MGKIQEVVEKRKWLALTRERMKQLDDELSATEIHEFRGINGCAMGNKGIALPFSVRCEFVRDLIKANEVNDEIKQHEVRLDF